MPEARGTRRQARRGAWLRAALAVALMLPGPGRAAPPDQFSLDLQARLEGLAARLGEPDAAGRPAAALIEESGVMAAAGLAAPAMAPTFAAPDDAPAASVAAQRLDVRLALTMLSQSQGEEENGAVLGAQTEPGLDALALTGGRATLGDVLRAARELGLPAEAEGRALTLRVPLVVWPGAELRLEGEDALRLSRADGAFLLNFGALRMRGGTVAAVGEPNGRIPSFVPFVASGEGGAVDLVGARLEGLGFGETAKFSGFSVLRGLLARPIGPTRIEDSTFAGLLTVSVGGDDGIGLRGNRFRDARGPALVVERARGARVVGNLFSGAMPTNAIRLGGSDGALVAGNVILGGERAGVVVRRGGAGTVVAGNVVWGRDGGGIVLSDTPCGTVTGNLVIANRQKGVELRGSPGGVVEGNRILSNQSIAVWVSDQPAGSLIAVRANQVAWNGAGLAAARGGAVLLDGNDFSGQFLRILDGDLAPQSAQLARDLRGADPMVLSAAGRADAPATPPPCPG